MTIYRAERITADDTEIPAELFGFDHWRMLLLVADCGPEAGLNPAHLRTATDKRPSFAVNPRHPGEHPTLVKASKQIRKDGRHGVVKLYGHDDIDCLEDLERADLIAVEGPSVVSDRFVAPGGGEVLDSEGEPLSPFSPPGEVERALFSCARWHLTRHGATVAAALRGHRDGGRTLHSFAVPTSFDEVGVAAA